MNRKVDAGWGIAAIRLVMGLILIVAGSQKWMGGIGGFSGFVGQVGVPGADVVGPLIATGEVLGGLLILLGVKARYVALWFIAEFIVTSFVVKLPKQGWDAGRIDMMMLAGSVLLLLAGAGKLAVDNYLVGRQTSSAPLRTQAVATR